MSEQYLLPNLLRQECLSYDLKNYLIKKLMCVYSILLMLTVCLLSLFGCKKAGIINTPTVFKVPDRIDQIIKQRIEDNFENKVYLAKISLRKPTQYKFYGDDIAELGAISYYAKGIRY